MCVECDLNPLSVKRKKALFRNIDSYADINVRSSAKWRNAAIKNPKFIADYKLLFEVKCKFTSSLPARLTRVN